MNEHLSPALPGKRSVNLFFSVGEPSGDLHAANLLHSLRNLGLACTTRGFGGPRMADAGCLLDYELTDLAVVGFVEVVPKLREFFRVADQASDIFLNDRPDAVVLVDFPGFNWHIAKRAKQFGIPVFYYLPPQLWAWGGWRIAKMRRYIDHILCNLPFEKQWYEERGLSAEYVGHPFFDQVASGELDTVFLDQWAEHDGCQVAVLPGSRGREVKNIWPMQLEAIRELAQRYPRTRFLVACLKEAHRAACKQRLEARDQRLDLQFFAGKTSEIIELADCSLMKSGSVSLEMMARGTPAVVVYHVGRTFYTIGRRLTNLQRMTLPNLIADQTIMPEFLAVGNRKSDTIEKSIAAMDRLLGDREERIRQRNQLLKLTQMCGQPGASKRAASILCDRLGMRFSREPSTGAVEALRNRIAA